MIFAETNGFSLSVSDQDLPCNALQYDEEAGLNLRTYSFCLVGRTLGRDILHEFYGDTPGSQKNWISESRLLILRIHCYEKYSICICIKGEYIL